jgi:hypothetical protein
MPSPRISRLVALVALAAGIGLPSAGTSVAQPLLETVETISDSYKIGRLTLSDGAILETLLYDGRPIASGVVLPARAGGATASGALSTPASGPSERAGTRLSGHVSGKYFILHQTRADKSTVHEVFFDGLSIGRLVEDAADPWRPISTRQPSGNAGPSGAKLAPSARVGGLSFESGGDLLVMRLAQPDGAIIRATSRNGARLERVIERRPVVAPDPIASASNGTLRVDAEPGPKDPPVPLPQEAKQTPDGDPSVVSAVGEPPKSTLPTFRPPLPRLPPRAANAASPATPRRPGAAPQTYPGQNSFVTAAPASSSQQPQFRRTAPQRSTP